MAITIELPKLGATMETGTIVSWLVQPGEYVEEGDPIAEVQTDKIVLEIEAEQDGYLLKTLVEPGEEVAVYTKIAYIGDEGELVDDIPIVDSIPVPVIQDLTTINTLNNTEKIRRTPAARVLANQHHISLGDVKGSGPLERIQRKDVEKVIEQQLKATPLARKMIKEQQIDPSEIVGSGVNGKIKKQDVSVQQIPVRNSNLVNVPVSDTFKLSGLRKVIAHNISQSFYTAPHVTLHSEVDMTEAVALRHQLLPVIEKQTGERLSFNEMIIKAVSLTLVKHPQINRTIQEDQITQHGHVSIGMAVAVENGLVVPVIHNTETLSLGSITKQAKILGNKARNGELLPDAYQGSTFSISNLGMYAVEGFTPIINQPNTAILGIGCIKKKPVVFEEEIVPRSMMTMSLSFDHRIIDGAPAAAFLTDVKETLENPLSILI